MQLNVTKSEESKSKLNQIKGSERKSCQSKQDASKSKRIILY